MKGSGTDQTQAGSVKADRRSRQIARFALAASASGTRTASTPSGKSGEQSRRKGPVKHREHPAIVGSADEASVSLAQPQPRDLVGILRAAKNRPPRAVQNIRARPRHAVKHDQPQRAAGHIDTIADRIRAEEAGIFLGAKYLDQGRGRHRLDMLGKKQNTAGLERRSDALVDRPQTRDRGEKTERAAAGGDE